MVKATFLGHSCVSITDGHKTVVIDPFLTGNPKAAAQPNDLDVDAVLVTHGHSDHLGDAIPIAKRCKVPIIGVFELCNYCQSQGATVHPMHIGGAHTFDFGRVKLTPALHGSAVSGNPPIYTGNPVGFLVEMGERTVYHSGDTGVSAEMEVIGRLHSIDLAFLPIGDNFTMGIDDAVEAVRMLHPKTVVPFHYDTFDLIAADPKAFAAKAKDLAQIVILKPGESVEV